MASFFQTPPALGNQLDDDRVLRAHLDEALPPDLLAELLPRLREMGELAGGKLYQMQLADRRNEPTLTSWDPWGHRVDRIDVTPLWQEAKLIAAREGVVATAYDKRLGPHARTAQFALAYLFNPSTDVYSCPLAMTDGAARTLLTHDNKPIVDRAIPHLLSRDPATFWTSGQWMTERTGGSDVGISETVAKKSQGPDGADVWKLHGVKWFTSATTSEMALTLARPEGNPMGGRGLALFYLERSLPSGLSNGISVNRLKDKLGTRKVPTAELTLDGTLATPVTGLSEGVRSISPMLNVTRTWNSVCAVSAMRRGLALSRDYAKRRVAFGAPLAEKPLHLETLAGLQAEMEAAFHLTFFSVALLGRVEAGDSSEADRVLLRMATPIVKATTGKQVMPVVSEVLESFGGAGYIEDTGLPVVLRDAQVLPIWEGTTNVLSLDLLRAFGPDGEGLRRWREEAGRRVAGASGDLGRCAQEALSSMEEAAAWLAANAAERKLVEAAARSVLLCLGRSMALALLVEHASKRASDRRPAASAIRFARHGTRFTPPTSLEDASLLANDS